MIDLFFSIAPVADKVIMAILALFSVLVLGVSLERYFALRPLYRKSRQTRKKLKNILQSGSLNEIDSLAEDTSHPEGRVMSYAITHIKKNGSLGLSEMFKAAYLQEKPTLEGSISLLATIGANAPFVGLLGTVFGIMKAFHDLGTTQEANQQVVMAGISIALLATAIGLAVAIPSVILYNYFRRRVSAILDTLENVESACLAYSFLPPPIKEEINIHSEKKTTDKNKKR